jgi:TonB family protein
LVIAGELYPGDSVGIEFRLPDAGGPFRLKAIVRYQALLHCGLEFVSLTSEQQTLIEHWTRRKAVTNPIASSPDAGSHFSNLSSGTALAPSIAAPRKNAEPKRRGKRFRRATWAAVAAVLLLSALGWWHWHQAWGELESQIPASGPPSQQPPTYVPAEAMQGLLTHKIEPIYPEAARLAKVQGVVVLDALIGADGTVVDLRAISGPDELTSAALDAVKWWRFQPYLVNGQAVQVKTRLAVDFRQN